MTVGTTVDEAAFLYTSMEHACQGQLLCESVAVRSAASSNEANMKKVLITDEEATFNAVNDSHPETLYAEFQVYYDFEVWWCEEMMGGRGDFRL